MLTLLSQDEFDLAQEHSRLQLYDSLCRRNERDEKHLVTEVRNRVAGVNCSDSDTEAIASV